MRDIHIKKVYFKRCKLTTVVRTHFVSKFSLEEKVKQLLFTDDRRFVRYGIYMSALIFQPHVMQDFFLYISHIRLLPPNEI